MADQRERIANFEASLRAAILGCIAETWHCLPGIVQSYSAQEMTVKVQPAIKIMVRPQSGNPQPQQMPQLIHVPVLFMISGGFALTFPISQGDECLIFFADRCIDGWWQNGGVQTAPELRVQDIGDGFAFMGPKSQPNVLSGLSTTTAQLRTLDGSAYIELTSNGKVNIVAPGGVKITGDVEIDGTLQVDDAVTLQSDLTVQGDATVEGTSDLQNDVSVTGTVTATEEGTFNGGHTVSAHVHPGVQTGSGDTGAPTG
jgi:Phage protein Gp138 N-terminal domain/GpV Apex motif